ncbi:hypothetical protein CFP56_012053 [Quercus suber]|uniref:Transmembrane protein n=1 Tax=Quercus suber TaxID=58331 RepID=A0AAW0KW29_QUESU
MELRVMHVGSCAMAFSTIVRDATLILMFNASNVLHYHKPHGTTNMSIPSLSVILLKMTLMNITVIFVKKNEIPSNGSTTVKIAVILLIPITLLQSNNGGIMLNGVKVAANKIAEVATMQS